MLGGSATGELFRKGVLRRALEVVYRYRGREEPFARPNRADDPVVLILQDPSIFITTTSLGFAKIGQNFVIF